MTTEALPAAPAVTPTSPPLPAPAPGSASVRAHPGTAAGTSGRAVTSLAVLGDSIAVGLGDPLPTGEWRGFGALLAAALGPPDRVQYLNLAVPGARMAGLRHHQLPGAVRARPDVAVLLGGMNDTLRSDFDPTAVRDDLLACVGALQGAGTLVVIACYHQHDRVFWLPGPLRRALNQRVGLLNEAIGAVAAATGAPCLDLDLLPGVYETAAWSVDRLHPSERGHRMLAAAFADLLLGAGIEVPHAVDLHCSGGRPLTTAHHVAWLVCEGLPWLGRRGRDFLPHAAGVVLRDLRARAAAVGSGGVR